MAEQSGARDDRGEGGDLERALAPLGSASSKSTKPAAIGTALVTRVASRRRSARCRAGTPLENARPCRVAGDERDSASNQIPPNERASRTVPRGEEQARRPTRARGPGDADAHHEQAAAAPADAASQTTTPTHAAGARRSRADNESASSTRPSSAARRRAARGAPVGPGGRGRRAAQGRRSRTRSPPARG